MCGMPFSGKTTLGKSIAEYLEAPYVSLDEINEARGLFGGDGIPVEEWEKTHHLAMQLSAKLIKTGFDIILDDTNCFRWLRDRFRDFASQHGYQTVVVFLNVPLSEIWRRIQNNNRTKTRHTVKQSIVREMAQTFEPPQDDEAIIIYTVEQPIDKWLDKHFAADLNYPSKQCDR